MLHINEVRIFEEPRNIVMEKYKMPSSEPEMSPFESAFLCGLLKEKKPENIVEVGVAGGGTTCIILQCMEMLSVDNYHVYSVDYSERFYRDNSFRCGYLADPIIKDLRIEKKHTLCLGDIAYNFLKESDKEIDFLILDTVHVIPGEILDALCLIPKMKDGGCVVLHDIAYNLHSERFYGMANGTLLASVTAEKYLNYDKERVQEYPNIGAFIVNKDTKENMDNLLLDLMLTWKDDLNEDQKEKYTVALKDIYSMEFSELFEKAYNLNRKKMKYKTRLKEAIKTLIRGR